MNTTKSFLPVVFIYSSAVLSKNSSFLVYPDMTFEKIDVRREEDRTKLYELVN